LGVAADIAGFELVEQVEVVGGEFGLLEREHLLDEEFHVGNGQFLRDFGKEFLDGHTVSEVGHGNDVP
jgi:hypothetical protein